MDAAGLYFLKGANQVIKPLKYGISLESIKTMVYLSAGYLQRGKTYEAWVEEMEEAFPDEIAASYDKHGLLMYLWRTATVVNRDGVAIIDYENNITVTKPSDDFDYLFHDSKYDGQKTSWSKILIKAALAFVKIILGLSYIALWLGGIGIHLWTIIIAFEYSGFLSAFITFLLPVLSQIYWGWESYVLSGTFWNNYIIMLLVYVCAWILMFGSAFVASMLGDD